MALGSNDHISKALDLEEVLPASCRLTQSDVVVRIRSDPMGKAHAGTRSLLFNPHPTTCSATLGRCWSRHLSLQFSRPLDPEVLPCIEAGSYLRVSQGGCAGNF